MKNQNYVNAKRPRIGSKLFAEDKFGILLVLILISIILTSGSGNHIVMFVASTVQLLVLLVALKSSGVKNKWIAISTVGALLSIIVATLFLDGLFNQSATPERNQIFSIILGLILSILIPVLVLRRLSNQQEINISTVFGALCVYLQIGLVFSFIYLILGMTSSGNFFAGKPADGRSTYAYYSFSTLTTVGYGDYTAESSLGQMFSVSEAIMGQLYLVGGIALVVGNLGMQKKRPIKQQTSDQPNDPS